MENIIMNDHKNKIMNDTATAAAPPTHLRRVLHGLVDAELNVGGAEEEGPAPEEAHSGLRRHARAGRALLKDHRHGLADQLLLLLLCPSCSSARQVGARAVLCYSIDSRKMIADAQWTFVPQFLSLVRKVQEAFNWSVPLLSPRATEVDKNMNACGYKVIPNTAVRQAAAKAGGKKKNGVCMHGLCVDHVQQ